MIITAIEAEVPDKKRVACYARVSSKAETQTESYETQLKYFKGLIDSNPTWTFHKMYSDKGRSGTDVTHRPGFMEMVADARAEKFDILLVKSVSRFGRNVGQVRQHVDILQSHNVTVFFQEQNIRTDDPTANFNLALSSAIAQDESHSISENRKWTYQKRYAEGKFNLGNNRILGYDTDKNAKLVPNADAWIVKEIFEKYVAGENFTQIAREMNAKGARTLRGREFSFECIRYILKNETYVGDKHLMKNPPTDYLDHRPDERLEYKDYYLTDDHEGIVSREVWDAAQRRMAQEAEALKEGVYSGGDHHVLYGKVFCADCGSPFKRRTVTANGSYYKTWNCRERQKGRKGNGCKMRIIKEDELLKEVCAELGWAEFDEAKAGEIERVMIGQNGIAVTMKKEVAA